MKIPDWLKVYGDMSYRGECAAESADQITVFNNMPEHIKRIAIHPRNEGKRTHNQARWQKAEGSITLGASDIIIPGWPTFVCELKRKDHTKSKWQPGQIDYLDACNYAGCFVCLALGWEAALVAIQEWEDAQVLRR